MQVKKNRMGPSPLHMKTMSKIAEVGEPPIKLALTSKPAAASKPAPAASKAAAKAAPAPKPAVAAKPKRTVLESDEDDEDDEEGSPAAAGVKHVAAAAAPAQRARPLRAVAAAKPKYTDTIDLASSDEQEDEKSGSGNEGSDFELSDDE